MAGKTKNVWLIKFALSIAGKKMWSDLEKKSKNSRKAQHEVLMNILHWAKDTVYGTEHGFNRIKTVEDFQRYVPINDYATLQPYIKRHTEGEGNVLFPGKPFLYATTSGTTDEPKWIPITEKYYKECYNELSKLWLYSLLREIPDIFDGPDLSIVGKAVEGFTPDGTPYGSFSGHVYENIPRFLRAVHVVPAEVYYIADYFSRYYCLLRFTLEQEIRLIITGNPSTLLELHTMVQSRIDQFINDIERGTLNPELKIEETLRNAIVKNLKPNPARARQLKELTGKYKNILPKHYWPTLQVINTWRCGNSGLYVKHLEGIYPDNTKIREFGYIATEARAGIILNNDQIPSILAAHLLFFEFIRKTDIGMENPKVYRLHELERGEYYYIFVTTPSGLYRYNMNDIIRIEGYYNDFPMILFIQKGAGVTSITGEKLHEEQLIDAVTEVEKVTGLKTSFYIGFADVKTSRYRLFVEFKDKHHSKETLLDFCKSVDITLKKKNIEYESKTESNRLKPLVVHILKSNSFEEFKADCMKKGYRDGQFKLTHLMADDIRMNMFKTLTEKDEITYDAKW